LAWSLSAADPRGATVMMRVAGGTFLGMTAGALLVRGSRPGPRRPPRPVPGAAI
jgi:hypothetical protein